MTGLILHLEWLVSEDKDVRHPPPGHDAVTLITYHSAKGLEWPVVILSGLNSERDPDMWSPVVSGGDLTHDNPLAGRVLRFWLWPFGYSEGEFTRPLSGTGLETDALQSPEGQNRTQQEQDENLRLLYVGVTRAKNKLVFAHRIGRYAWLDFPTSTRSLTAAREKANTHWTTSRRLLSFASSTPRWPTRIDK